MLRLYALLCAMWMQHPQRAEGASDHMGILKEPENGQLLKRGGWEEQVMVLEMELGGWSLDMSNTGHILGASLCFYRACAVDM